MEQLTRTGAISSGPPNLESLLTLATDGNRILTSVVQEGRPRLSAISLSNGEVNPLPLPRELVASSLADISRDGSRLILKSQLSTASEQPLWVVPSSGGSAQRVGDVLAHDASCMPDGKSVLYADENDLSVIRLDDGVSTPFAHLSGRAFWMRWSPDGKLLRFTLMDPLSHATGLWELPSRGGAPHRLKTPATGRQRRLLWNLDVGWQRLRPAGGGRPLPDVTEPSRCDPQTVDQRPATLPFAGHGAFRFAHLLSWARPSAREAGVQSAGWFSACAFRFWPMLRG